MRRFLVVLSFVLGLVTVYIGATDPRIGVSVARAQVIILPPLPSPAQAGPAQQNQGTGRHSSAGPAVVVCVSMAAGSTIVRSIAQGNDPEDPRQLTGREAAIAAGTGCPPLFILVAFYPPDNDGTYTVARLAHLYLLTEEGQMLFALCRRGQIADGCASPMDVFSFEMGYAYRTGHVRPEFLKAMASIGVRVKVVGKTKKHG